MCASTVKRLNKGTEGTSCFNMCVLCVIQSKYTDNNIAQ